MTLVEDRPDADAPPLSRVVTGALVALTATLGVVALADAAQEHDGVSRIDPTAAADVVAGRSTALTALAHVLTFVGSEVVVGVAAVLLLLVLLLRRDLDRAVVFGAGMFGSAVLTYLIKVVVERPRPGAADRLGPVDSSFSFPSGHTLNTTVFLVLACWLAWPVLSRGLRPVVAGAAVLLTVGVGASRVYLGYHWLTDVVASTLVAAAWLSVLVLVAPVLRSIGVPLLDRVLPGGARPGRRRAAPGSEL